MKAVPVSTTTYPVTQTADVGVNNALRKDNPNPSTVACENVNRNVHLGLNKPVTYPRLSQDKIGPTWICLDFPSQLSDVNSKIMTI